MRYVLPLGFMDGFSDMLDIDTAGRFATLPTVSALFDFYRQHLDTNAA
jgi:hypothetical protein